MYLTISSGGTCRFKYVEGGSLMIALILRRIFEAEHGIIVVVGECLGIARPTDDRAQGLVRLILAHEIFQFVDEAALARGVARTLIEHPAYVRGQRHVVQEVARENPLALIDGGMYERQPIFGEFQVTAFEFREAQHLERFGYGGPFVDFRL